MDIQRKLEIIKEAKKRKIHEEAKTKLNSFTAGYSEWEAMVWAKLKEEAERFNLDGTVGEYMTAEIGVKYDATTLAATVLAKAEAMKNARAAVILERQQKEALVDALTVADILGG